MSIDINRPAYALVQLAEDSNATIVYVILGAFHPDDLKTIATGNYNNQLFRCAYTENYDLCLLEEHFADLPVSKEFQPRIQAVYHVRILSIFHWEGAPGFQHPIALCERSTFTNPLELEFLEQLDIVNSDLNQITHTSCLETMHSILLHNNLSDLLASQHEELIRAMHQLLMFTCGQNSKVLAVQVCALIQLQLSDPWVRVMFAQPTLSIVEQIMLNVINEKIPTLIRAQCCRIYGTMTWLHGAAVDMSGFGRLLQSLSGLLAIPIGKIRPKVVAVWLQFQAAVVDTLGLLVTQLPAQHVCSMWRSSSPMVPSLSQLLDLLSTSVSLEVRIRVANLIAIILEYCRSHEADFMVDKTPEIAAGIVDNLAESDSNLTERGQLSESDQRLLNRINASIRSGLKAEPVLLQRKILLDSWSAQHRYAALEEILVDSIDMYFEHNSSLSIFFINNKSE